MGAQVRERAALAIAPSARARTGLVSEIASDVDFEAKGTGRAVSAALAPGLRVSGHAELLRRAIENILRDAVRFSPDGGVVSVTLATLNSSGKRKALRLEVRDHGPGVPEASLADIFWPFFRVETARDRDTGGAGIGLAIVERSVRLHGATVRADNAEGGGLELVIELALTP